MDEMDIRHRAGAARDLLNGEDFNLFLEECKQKQVDIFLSASATIENINQAHEIIRGLSAFEDHLQAAIADEKLFEQKLKN